MTVWPFDQAYTATMLRLEKARCEHCGKSVLAHSARHVKQACYAIPVCECETCQVRAKYGFTADA